VALTTRCLDCGCRTKGSRCATCQPRRDAEHGHASGRNLYAWQKLRAARKQLDGHRCVYCGSTRDLTVDLDPRFRGDHRHATINDCVTACRTCNSRRGNRFRRDGRKD
jgi:5-methylcytosine-specific restriction endonuclease McrA